MPYTVHDFESGDILMATQLNEMDDQIAAVTSAIESGGAGGGAYTIVEGLSGVEVIDNSQNVGS